VEIHGRAVMTNTPPNGAFRGFGAPQTQFAVEAHMDVIAQRLRLDPVSLRLQNALRPLDRTATDQLMLSDCSALEVLRTAVERSGFREKRLAWRGSRRGIGLSLFYHGSGFTGSGEVHLASKVALQLTETGVRILTASVEMGQGTRTMLAQIVADAIGIRYEDVEVAQPDTAFVPDSGPTVASRTCLVVGRILQRCAAEMRTRLAGLTPAEYLRAHGPLTITREYEKPRRVEWDEERYLGDAYASYGWGCNVIEVDLDPVTYEIRPTRATIVHEIGRAIHPSMVVGQIEGGTLQGIGWALNERVVMRDGAMVNAQLTNYTIPTTLDTPPMEVIVLEVPTEHGPFGAKGVGEMPIDGPAAAVVNAIRSLGIGITEIPATPERVMEAACASA
jgi:CO/xanthine dehydrogenase Mo-binding subunit